MHIAMRIDFARSQVGGSDARLLALALASGIAGLTVTYPTITAGNGTAGEWMGRLEVKPPHLTMPAISPDMSISAKFHDTALAVTDAVKASAAGLTSLSNVLTPEIASVAEADTTGLTERVAPEALSKPIAERNDPVARLAPSKSPATSGNHSVATRTRLPEPASTTVEGGAIDARAPLDAVRIALPPTSTELGMAGALPPKATLNGISVADPGSPALASGTETQSLAASTQPEVLPVSTPGQLSETRPFSLLSASREVRDFDLATLNKTKPATRSLARSSVDTLASAPAKATPHAPNLSRVAKVPDRIVGNYILHIAGLSLEGVPSGNLPVRIGMSGDLSVKLADLMIPVQDQMAPATFERLVNSSAASEYVSFAELRAAGFDIRYDAGNDRLMVSAHL